MAGTLTLTTLSDGTNSTSSTNAIKGSAKAWVFWTGGSTPAIQNSYNISSITRNTTGKFSINFTSAMPNANYVTLTGGATTTGSYNSTVSIANNPQSTNPQKTTYVDVWVTSNASLGSYEDPNFIGVAIITNS